MSHRPASKGFLGRPQRFWPLLAAGLLTGPGHATLQAGTLAGGWSGAFYPGNDLGAVYTPAATRVKLWAPTALAVQLKIFRTAAGPDFTLTPMTGDAQGIWSAELPGDRSGEYYLYQVTLPGAGNQPPRVTEVNDPYAHGSSANSGRTLIYDPAPTDPPDWAQDQFVTLRHRVDAVLYEAQVRDFTIDPSAGVAPAWRGKFLGLAQAGATNAAGLPTGLDHLVELGITHVQLLPVFDYAGGDERQSADHYTWYDWGYDPVLFDNPEGSYATDADGTARQREFKRLVQALHRRRIGVVMDVVFNHTAATGDARFSIFDRIYPGYYYRQAPGGGYANGSGCGNELASERPMVRKFIVDSIKYWMTEYHVDGFRFDLMGLLDRDTMLAVERAARAINPGAILYGEGWSMEQALPPERMMTQAAVAGTGLAAFNDGLRDNLKGDAGRAAAPGFVQGCTPPYGGMARFELNLKGQATGRDTRPIPVAAPGDSINYDSVHDDLCLWDKLRLSAPEEPEAARERMDLLAAGLLLTAQGVPFLHAGDEFLRSKSLVANSYNNNDPGVNPVDWNLKTAHAAVFEFYRGMIALRRDHPAFRLTRAAEVDAALEFAPASGSNLVAYLLRDHAGGDAWRNILVIGNGTGSPRTVAVTGRWMMVVSGQDAGEHTLATARDRIPAPAWSLVVAHTEDDCHFVPQAPDKAVGAD